MKIKFSFGVIAIFLLCNYAHSYPEPISTKNGPTAQVATLVEKLVMADAKQSKVILDEIDSIRRKNPENTDILLMYTNSLIGKKHYKEGLNFLTTLYEKKPIRTYLLTQCMLKERLGGSDKSCYKEVVRISEQQDLIDSDYVTALFFTDTEKFNTVQRDLIKKKDFKKSDFLIYTLGQQEMLHEIFP